MKTARVLSSDVIGIQYPKGDDAPIEVNIPGLCNTDTITKSYKNKDGLLHRVRCNTDITNEVNDKAWISNEPYSMARRPLSDTDLPSLILGRKTVNQESYNYAKALLRSDKELERLAEKITSEIDDSEMLEVALLAEQAAAEGLETFSSQPYTYRGDHNTPLKGQNASYPEGLKVFPSISSEKIKARDLRHVSEVIPDFGALHGHMRTHLFRQSVDEKTLVYKDTLEKTEEASTSRPLYFFKNIGLKALQKTTEETANMSDDASSSSSASETFGSSALSSHISHESLQIRRRFSSSSSNEHETPRETVSLFDEDNDEPSRPSSPQNLETGVAKPSSLYPEAAMTPKVKDYQGPQFFTPARLRDIRDSAPFSPSSIVESSNGLDDDMAPPKNKRRPPEESEFLQLPEINAKPKIKENDAIGRTTTTDQEGRKHVLRLNKQRFDMDEKEESTCVNVPVMPELSSKTKAPEAIHGRQDILPTLSAKTKQTFQDPKSPTNVEEKQSNRLLDSYLPPTSTGMTAGKTIGLTKVSSWPKKDKSWINRTSSSGAESLDVITKSESGSISTLQQMFAKLSPRLGGRQEESIQDVENIEFLSNYFYCPKPKGVGNVPTGRQSGVASFNCGRHGMLCGGVETVCAGLDFWFVKNRKTRKTSTISREKDKLVSDDENANPSKLWLDVLARNRLARDEKEIFQAPLKKSNFGSTGSLKY